MPILVVTNELPQAVRRSIAGMIVSTLGRAEGDWKVSLTSDEKNNAWDIDVSGPDRFQWARRFSGKDRDAEVILEAMRDALEEFRQPSSISTKDNLNEALSSLAAQGIAFTEAPGQTVERKYIVDRVLLGASEIIYLHTQGALTTNGIRTYLLTRDAA